MLSAERAVHDARARRTLGTPYTIEAATNLTNPASWTPIFTTNPPALPFEFTDFDVRIAAYRQKFYRVRQP